MLYYIYTSYILKYGMSSFWGIAMDNQTEELTELEIVLIKVMLILDVSLNTAIRSVALINLADQSEIKQKRLLIWLKKYSETHEILTDEQLMERVLEIIV